MDALSEALVAVHATGAIFFRVECRAPWGFAVPNVDEAAPMLSPRTERIVNYHLVTEGRALVRFANGEELPVTAGDIVILPHGDAHTVSNGHAREYAKGSRALEHALSGRPATIRLGEDGGEPTRIVCGFIGCQRSADRLFLAGLPDSLRVSLRNDGAGDWLVGSIQHLVSEAESERPGAAILLSRMAESLFVEALRRIVARLPAEQTGWLAGARDPIVGAALALLHRRPSHAWTLTGLAHEAGTSRSVLAKRFVHFLGETPTSYLRQWRLHLAAERLRTSRDPVLQIAMDVGYQSEAAFNRAFGIAYGRPPAQYRRAIRRDSVASVPS